MKSRKAQKRSSSSSNKSALRRSVQRNFETLEDRRLMTVQPWSDGGYYFPGGENRADMVSTADTAKWKAISKVQFADYINRGSSGEGAGPSTQVAEVEPNNTYSQAQFINLGNLPGQFQQADVLGTLPRVLNVFDEDLFAVNLQAGDIVDIRLTGASPNFDVSMLNGSGVELVGNNLPITGGYPAVSPLTISRTLDGTAVSLAAIAPADGRYYIRVGGDQAYSMRLRTYRNPIEAEPIGTKQKIFLDFDGAQIKRDLFSGGLNLNLGTARLSPLSSFLPGWGLSAADENLVIDKIIASFKARFIGPGAPSETGGNGYFSGTGVAGDMDIEILNSRDNPDPWGLPNVSRIIIGGTGVELGILNIFGISESIDVGNFDREETAVVLLDSFFPVYSVIPRAGTSPLVDILTKAIASTSAHEAGHFFGNWHTDNTNAVLQLMDTGGVPNARVGFGLDGIFGTADDFTPHFGRDYYDATASAIPFGIEDSRSVIATALSTGMLGGFINGKSFFDINLNRVQDAGEPGLPSWRVFADINNDGVYQAGEPQALTRADGSYTLGVAAGSYVIREDLAPVPGFRLTTPLAGYYAVTVANGQTVSNIVFGNERIDQTVTGFKFNDLNGNGLSDVGEPRIAGVWIYIDLDGDERLDLGEPQTKTGVDGRYTLKFPGTGTYVIRELVDPGYVQTLPGAANNNRYIVTVTGNAAIDGPNLAGKNFGNRLFLDFGDAPATYGTLLANDGARHGFVQGLNLGTNWDAEQNGLPTANALGDDNNGTLDSTDTVIDDEDGVILARPISRTSTNILSVTASTTTTTAYLQGWIDLNGDGDFTDSGEKIITNQVITTGTQAVTFPSLGGAKLGSTYMRIRLSQDQNLGPTGLSASGEVEDYLVTIVDTAQIALADSYEVSRNSTLNSLDVTANDFTIPGEVLTIVNAGPSLAGGVLQVTSDNKILYTPPNGFVGTDTFPYTVQSATGETSTANVTITVNLFFEDPNAIDDSFDVATNAISFPLNVLANDIEGRAGALSIISITQPNLGGQISIATGGQSLRYTPPRGLGDTEQFTYTVADASGKTSTATVTLHTLPGDQTNDDVLIRLVATDLNGNTITAIPQGQQFRIDVYVDDLRNDRSTPVIVGAPGVYAAYLDLLYNLQLVSTVASTAGGRFDFDVTFFNNYSNLQLGDATIPGIVNDLGAFNNSFAMNQPNPIRMASVKFAARSPGLATFKADPADDPLADTVLFDTQDTPVPVEKIRYIGTTLEIVGDSTEFPQAVDDSFTTNVPQNAISYPLLVLPNDRTGSTGSIRLFDVAQPANGAVTISNNGTPNDFTDDRVLYTPNSGFTGTDSFTYTIQDTRAVQSTAKVTVRVGSSTVTDANDKVSLRLQLYKTDGTPLADGETLPVGSKFQLRGFVKDLRSPFSGGVFAAFEDVIYSSKVASVDADTANPLGFAITFGPDYSRSPAVNSGDSRTPGLLNEVGAIQTGDTPLGPEEKLLFTVTLTANAVGTASFVGDPADISPLHDTLLFQPPTAVPFDEIRYGFDSVNIVAASGSGEGNTNPNNALDVNGDGAVSAIDALNVINALNTGGTRSLAGGEGEGPKLFVDVNADGVLSAMDALMVINYLNTRGAAAGEGEGQAAPVILSNRVAEGSTTLAASGVDIGPVANAALASQTSDSEGTACNAMDWASLGSGEGESLDSLLDAIAPEVESVWKKK